MRALELLKSCNVVACEDSRVTGKLLRAFDIRKPVLRYNDHSKDHDRDKILMAAREGIVALCSDAGTPLISDPGYKLVRQAREEGISVTSLPGACAFVTGMTLSALPTDQFLFYGFLPQKANARRSALEKMTMTGTTLVFYESPKRIAACLADMAHIWPERQASVARELTKLHEEVRNGSLSELAQFYAEYGAPRGEIVLMLAPLEAGEKQASDEELEEALKTALAEMGTSKAAAHIAETYGADRKKLYKMAIALKQGE